MDLLNIVTSLMDQCRKHSIRSLFPRRNLFGRLVTRVHMINYEKSVLQMGQGREDTTSEDEVCFERLTECF
ncbi:unnamed protein product [Citrullus colocynthis]|uniref:Uncharacterized protein n=1 Tax=Citrullus colocynthis TaxID=252529 RepID=A0ABP0YBE3_9ROSI